MGLSPLDSDLEVDLEGDLESDEFALSVCWGVGGSGLGDLGLSCDGSVLGDLGLRSSSGDNSSIGSGDCSFPGVGDRSLTCLSGEDSWAGLVDRSSIFLLGDSSGVYGGVGTCRAFTDDFTIVSVIFPTAFVWRIIIAFIRCAILLLWALISFFTLVIL